jgi:exopolyphosphatase/guanosine-5'-triphosphate,3'-diphosphate pyrophosphatase
MLSNGKNAARCRSTDRGFAFRILRLAFTILPMPTASRHPLRAAVLDLGSNSVKFMLGQQDGARLTVHREEAITTRLGHQLALTGEICRAARHATLRVLRHCQRAAAAYGAQKIIAVGTSALRSATNRDELLAPAREILGAPVRVVSGKLEGELVYAGATSYHRWRQRDILVIDIGGGSVEFVTGSAGRLTRAGSLPLGCVRVRDALLRGRQPVPRELWAATVSELAEQMRVGFKKFTAGGAVVLGSGGTCATLTALHRADHPRVPVHELEGLAIRRAEALTLLEFLASRTLAQLRAHPRIPSRRAEIITAGACVLLAAMRALGANTVHCTTRGLRYGVWQRMLAPTPFKTVRHEICHHAPGERAE